MCVCNFALWWAQIANHLSVFIGSWNIPEAKKFPSFWFCFKKLAFLKHPFFNKYKDHYKPIWNEVLKVLRSCYVSGRRGVLKDMPSYAIYKKTYVIIDIKLPLILDNVILKDAYSQYSDVHINRCSAVYSW